MIKGFFVRDGKIIMVEANDAPCGVLPPKPARDAVPLYLADEIEVIETKAQRRGDWRARRRNELRCNLIRASLLLAVILSMSLSMLLASDSFEVTQLPSILGAMTVPTGWMALVAYATNRARKKGTSAATE